MSRTHNVQQAWEVHHAYPRGATRQEADLLYHIDTPLHRPSFRLKEKTAGTRSGNDRKSNARAKVLERRIVRAKLKDEGLSFD